MSMVPGYAQVPTKADERCPASGLKRGMIYKLLPSWRAHPQRPVHVLELKEPGAKRGITLYKISDVVALLDYEAEQQATALNQ